MSDDAARRDAAHCFDENLVIVAGAGSGKTSLLIERLLCQMVERELGAEQFAAITFTEKAAAEMRRRLEAGLARLAARASDSPELGELDPGEEADRAFDWLRERVSPAAIAERAKARLFALAETEVTTIHGFCARLLRRHPLEAGVDPDFQVDTGGRFAEILETEWERFLSGPDGPEAEHTRERFARVLGRVSLRELANLAAMAAGFAIPGESLARGLPEAGQALEPLISALAAEVDSLGIGAVVTPGPESYAQEARRALLVLRDSGLDAFRRELETPCVSAVQGLRTLLADPPQSGKNETAKKLAKQLHGQLKKLRKLDDELLRDVLALLLPYARAVRAESVRRGVLPFDALLALARDLLANYPEVRRAVSERYRVLFLDEFQDTDPLQYEIVFLIAESPGGRLRPGSLFIVGDPKQAIYRFRGADITAYKQAVEQILGQPGARQLVLTRNFRSVPEVLEPLDRLFRSTFAPPAGTRADSLRAFVEYDGLEAAKSAAGERRIERWSVGAKANADLGREREAAAIADWVALEAAAGRLRLSQVALLLRALTDSLVYVRALRARGVPVWVGRIEEPERDPALQQLTALLRALANPADEPAVLAFLRSPLGGVPDAELARHATHLRGGWSYPTAQADASAVPNLARAFESLRRWRARLAAEPLAQVLVALRDESPLLALHGAAVDGVRRVADLSAMLDRLAARAAAAPEADLAHWVATLVGEEQRRSAEEPLPELEAVRILSVHGAKGLEFDVVVLADLGRHEPPDYADALRDSREQKALAVRMRAGVSSTWLERERIEESHKDAEARRLLYVAATRAKQRLVVVEAGRAYGVNARAFAGLLKDWRDPALVTRTIEPDALESLRTEPRPQVGVLSLLERTDSASRKAQAAARPLLARPSALELEEHAEISTDSDDELPPAVVAARAVGRAVGTALHDVLERWDFGSAKTARALLAPAVTRAARASGAPEPEVLSDATRILDSLLSSALPRALASVEILGRELPVLFRDSDGRAWSGTIDLLYRDPADNGLVVADYKTDREPDNDSRARYRAQLAVYARGVARLFPSEPPPRLELVWLRSGQRERLPLESAS